MASKQRRVVEGAGAGAGDGEVGTTQRQQFRGSIKQSIGSRKVSEDQKLLEGA